MKEIILNNNFKDECLPLIDELSTHDLKIKFNYDSNLTLYDLRQHLLHSQAYKIIDLKELLLNQIKLENHHPRRIMHMIKVKDIAYLIGKAEGLDDLELHFLQVVAIMHDCCINCSKQVFGFCNDQTQKELANEYVNKYLNNFKLPHWQIEWIIEYVKNHHDYDHINDKIMQYLIEADLIVNIFETNTDHMTYQKYIRSKTGQELFNACFM